MSQLGEPTCPNPAPTPPIKSPSPTWAALWRRTLPLSKEITGKLSRERTVRWPTTGRRPNCRLSATLTTMGGDSTAPPWAASGWRKRKLWTVA